MKTKLATLLTMLAMLTPAMAADPPADYGKAPTRKQAEVLVGYFLRSHLNDPMSIKGMEMTNPQPVALKRGALVGGGYTTGYQVNTRFFAKNAMGGYTGQQEIFFLIRDGRIAAFMQPGDTIWTILK